MLVLTRRNKELEKNLRVVSRTLETNWQVSLRIVSIPLASKIGSTCDSLSYLNPTYLFFASKMHGK